MSEVSSYIKHLKENFHASDDVIIQKLVASGWAKSDAETAVTLYELPDAPAAPHASQHHSEHKITAKNSLSSLSQAMQHILLWLFTISSTIMITVVASSIYSASASSTALSLYLAVSLVTFTPFAFVFMDYVKRFKKDKSTVTGRIWTIITIVLHSVAAIISGIVLIVNLLLEPTAAVIISTATIAGLNLLVVAVYYQATFGKPKSRFRTSIVYAFMPIIVAVLTVFGLFALQKLGPIRDDEQLRGRMIKTVEEVRTHRANNDGKLPATIQALKDVDTSGIIYKKTSDTSYSICGVFKTKGPDSYGVSELSEDSYVSDYTFYNDKPGEQCFKFTTRPLYQSNYEPGIRN